MMKQVWRQLVWGVVLSAWSIQSAAAAAPGITHGVASGEVTATSALIWARANRAATLVVEYAENVALRRSQTAGAVRVTAKTDFTGVVAVTGLQPATRYYYRVRPAKTSVTGVIGSFVTAPLAEQSHTVTFLWGGDLGGQGFCRQPAYAIFRPMAAQVADFFLFGGDTIYADSPCPSPPNAPGSDFVAQTQEQFWAKYKYQREDPGLRTLLAGTPVYAIWDDHEVKNDFAGPTQPLTPIGLQAFWDYFPFPRPAQDEHRLYRSYRWGKHLELFILDNRQYRSPNTQADGPDKTMLGAAQRQWLLAGLASSTATWQIIMSSVPLSTQTGSPVTGNDSWAKGAFSSGFDSELSTIVSTLQNSKKRNVVWLSTDIHVARMLSYDPDQDGAADFHEFISGPLSAITGNLDPLDETFHPQVLYEETRFFNFGVVRIDGQSGALTAEIRDQEGKVHYALTLPAQH
ncbi:MAG TPA: alkaline phosphatase D family protein [Methylomirabilota bacterium]|nr:alkaline phosphatase D family protein [Methylomirabilota bacterium]